MLAGVLSAVVALAVCQQPVILVSGQSLSQGLLTGSALSTTQTLGNTKSSLLTQETTGLGIYASMTYLTHLSAWPMTSLVESSIESPRSAMANYYATARGVSVAVAVGSRGGVSYGYLARGSDPWNYMSATLEALNARSAGGAVCVGFYVEHGQADHQAGTSRSTYAGYLSSWQSDVSNKCRGSARGGDPPLFISQFSSWTSVNITGHATTSPIPMAVYDAARANFGRISLIGPNYNIAHGGDGVHLTAAGSRQLGAYAGKAIATGRSWQPLWPRLDGTAVSRTTNVITVHLYTPVPPLVVDTTNVTGVSSTTRGFEYTDDSSPPSITGVDCSAACSGNICSCQITLSGTPTGANKKLRYAYTGTDNQPGGPTTGPRGNIRDSDTASWQGTNLYNWLVHFEETVP